MRLPRVTEPNHIIKVSNILLLSEQYNILFQLALIRIIIYNTITFGLD